MQMHMLCFLGPAYLHEVPTWLHVTSYTLFSLKISSPSRVHITALSVPSFSICFCLTAAATSAAVRRRRIHLFDVKGVNHGWSFEYGRHANVQVQHADDSLPLAESGETKQTNCTSCSEGPTERAAPSSNHEAEATLH
jgi:hypothetical protein